MPNRRVGDARSTGSSHCQQQPIDLLTVQDDAKDTTGGPNIARGLSIKLVPPEDSTSSEEDVPGFRTESPLFYHSTSQMSAASLDSFGNNSVFDTDIPIPAQSDRLLDLDASLRLVGSPPPLHRTESRLPSLEDMLRDEKLSRALYEGAKSHILDELTHALTERDAHSRFRAIQAMIKKQTSTSTLDISKATPKQKTIIIDTSVLFVKQQLSRVVDYWRTMIDAREQGQITPEEFDSRILNPPTDYGSRPWAFVSLGLKVLRNFCTSADIQQLIFTHDLADSLIQRKRLMISAYAQCVLLMRDVDHGRKPERHFIEEVANSLPRSVMTFISNLVTNNDRLRAHLWPRMWPDCYWAFLVLAGEKFFDHFCLLLHNHMTPLLSPESAMPEGDDEVSEMTKSYSGDVRRLVWDLSLLDTTEEEVALKKANADADEAAKLSQVSKQLTDTFAAILLSVWRKYQHQYEGGAHRKARLASVQGRAYQEEAVGEDWFALFLLRLLSLGHGHSLRLLLTSLLQKEDPPDRFESADQILSYMGCPRLVKTFLSQMPHVLQAEDLNTYRHPTSADLAAIILYAVAEYASVPQDELTTIQKHVDEPDSEASTPVKVDNHRGVRDRSEQKLGRRWNLVRRSFLTTGTVSLMVNLLKECVNDLVENNPLSTHPQSQTRTKAWTNDHPLPNGAALCKCKHLANLIRPLIKCCISLLMSPELIGRWTDDSIQTCWSLAAALLTDVAPFFQAFLATPGTPEAHDYEKLLNIFSPRDALILLAALVQSSPDARDLCDEDTISVIMTYAAFQTLDVGCEQASHLTLKVVTENHPENAKSAAAVKSRNTRSELTAKQA